MKLYLFTRINDINWGECIGAVIAAPTEEIAEELVFDLETDGTWKCDLIAETTTDQIKQGIVLDSWSNE